MEFAASAFGLAPNSVTQLPGQKPVNRFLWNYGNFCGAGVMGTPIDGVDSACEAHDACYASNGFSPLSNFGAPNAALRGCNQKLCNAAAAAVQNTTSQNLVQGTAAMDIILYFGRGGVVGLIQRGNACTQ
jgi:hypothetical protein